MKEHRSSIGVLVVAYNAASTLAGVLDRIPPTFRSKITEVIVSDDSSSDATYLVGLGYQQMVPDLPLKVIRNERNLGYGGNQKVGYQLAIEHHLDIVVLLHGDGQYAPELLPEMVAPLERHECDAVFGSRMLVRGAARKGGMPAYKFVGNRILTRLENTVLGTELSEFHSGYRAYSVAALAEIDFMANSNGFDFDTEIIIQFHDKRLRILEIPIPTYYGDEICYVNGLRYARDVLRDVIRYRLSQVGSTLSTQRVQSDEVVTMPKEYTLKSSPSSSHGRILGWLATRAPRKVLDLGCSSGLLAAEMRRMGHRVTGVDITEFPEASARLDQFVRANLDEGIPSSVGTGYDVVIAGDVLEHVRHPDLLLGQIREVLAPGGLALVSIPNFSHWYPRFRVLAGRFDYDDQGILDRGHVRFFTRRSFERLVRRSGMRINRTESIGVPFERLTSSHGWLLRWVARLDRLAAILYPSLFAYQYLFEITPERGEASKTTRA